MVMRALGLMTLLIFGGLSGCTSYVRTYDADDKLLGSCMATVGLFGRGNAHCEGSANPKQQKP